jgi:Flp pilus assembly protein TadG
LVVILLPALVVLAGVAFDAGMLLTARREAYNIASSAARAGANDIEIDSIYKSRPVLSPTAPDTARAEVAAQGATPVAVSATERTIEVEVRQQVDMIFLGIIGIDSRTIEATATAEIQQAVGT